jgi:uncharacterized membrane protein YdjX (TVP38/TMEM64 family)
VSAAAPPVDDARATVRRRRLQRLAVAGVWLALLGTFWGWTLARGVTPAEAAVDLVDAIQGSAWGALAFVIAYLVRPLLLFSAAVLTVAGGFLFGPALGIALVVVAANASAMIAYGIGRWLGTDVEPDADHRLGRYVTRLRDRSFETVAVMRLLFLPYDLVNYLCGFLRIHPLAFLAGTAIGSAPATVAFVLFGASIEDFDGGVPSLDPLTLGLSIGLLLAAIGAAEILRRREGARAG